MSSPAQFYTGRSTDVPVLDERLSRIAGLVAEARPQRILDVACGRGTLMHELHRRLPGAQINGADLSESAVARVRELGYDATVADVTQALPFADESFDAVIFGEVIEHLVDPDAALLEISRVLARDGLLMLSTPNLASWANRLLLLAGIQPLTTETSLHVNLGRGFEFLGQWRPTQGHLKIFTRAALCEMLAGNGFDVRAVVGAPYSEASRFSMIDRAFTRFPSLASDLIVSAGNRRTLRTDYKRRPGWH